MKIALEQMKKTKNHEITSNTNCKRNDTGGHNKQGYHLRPEARRRRRRAGMDATLWCLARVRKARMQTAKWKHATLADCAVLVAEAIDLGLVICGRKTLQALRAWVHAVKL